MSRCPSTDGWILKKGKLLSYKEEYSDVIFRKMDGTRHNYGKQKDTQKDSYVFSYEKDLGFKNVRHRSRMAIVWIEEGNQWIKGQKRNMCRGMI